ncbi:hypothetical protein J2D73_14465 [Acetobacter sacchari]|uniref:Uncharacterized protein n=1 Tax=Acetobacter sacchari TaxID=2661687 RepID=A0ABS3LYI8_9PROT|nr:hypothetical protein [Acetobacter sacchari]MBO1360989.1 hypothetical protein [Acetobacter sacchari]
MQILSSALAQTTSATYEGSEGHATAHVSGAPAEKKTSVSADTPLFNPASHIDPALGIVVVETYGTNGVVEDQYPTARMMEQYSLYGLHQAS